MSTLDYKFWIRKYTKQRMLLRLLQLELAKDNLRAEGDRLGEEERREMLEMIEGLQAQIVRRKRDMLAAAERIG
jgi:hypothetical protein